MSEKTEISPRKMPRREFLQRALTYGGGKILNLDKERLSEHDLKIAAMRLNGPYPNVATRSDSIMRQIEKVLRSERPDVVLTPEFTFAIPNDDTPYDSNKAIWIDNVNRNLYKPLILDQKNESLFQVHSASHPKYKEIISRARGLASLYRAHLLLATFPEIPLHGQGQRITMLHIDDKGDIVARKRKYEAPEGNWIITDRTGIPRKALPMICQDVWWEYDIDPVTKRYKYKPPSWAKQGEPYDFFVHPMSQGDLNFNEYGKLMRMADKTKEEYDELSVLKERFKEYYSSYWSLLRNGAPLLVADGPLSGIFYENAPPTYTETHSYASSGVDFDVKSKVP